MILHEASNIQPILTHSRVIALAISPITPYYFLTTDKLYQPKTVFDLLTYGIMKNLKTEQKSKNQKSTTSSSDSDIEEQI